MVWQEGQVGGRVRKILVWRIFYLYFLNNKRQRDFRKWKKGHDKRQVRGKGNKIIRAFVSGGRGQKWGLITTCMIEDLSKYVPLCAWQVASPWNSNSHPVYIFGHTHYSPYTHLTQDFIQLLLVSYGLLLSINFWMRENSNMNFNCSFTFYCTKSKFLCSHTSSPH
jgi:hypothetical protein